MRTYRDDRSVPLAPPCRRGMHVPGLDHVEYSPSSGCEECIVVYLRCADCGATQRRIISADELWRSDP